MARRREGEDLESLPAGMRAALRAARRGAGTVSPNPIVGACLERPGMGLLISFHGRFGGPHAEARLLARVEGADPLPPGSTLHITLEPCSHQGKTPPCVDRILAARPSEVIVAVRDPNPLVAGRGIRRLRKAGIAVRVGPGERDAVASNLPFFICHRLQRASVRLKLAASLDGRLARAGRGGARWISGPEARRRVHGERARADAVLVGADTVLRDRPRLNVRAVPGSQPSRIVLDSALRTPVRGSVWRAWREEFPDGLPEPPGTRRSGAAATGNWVQEGGRGPSRWVRRPRLILATARGHEASRLARFRAAGWETWELPLREGHASLPELLRRAAREGFLQVLAEAGPRLSRALLEADLVDELSLYLAPLVLGGPSVWPEAGRGGLETGFEAIAAERVGADLWIGYRRCGRIERVLERPRGSAR